MKLISGPMIAKSLTTDTDQTAQRDDRLERRIEHALKDVGCHPLRQIRVSSDHGRVTLNGEVPTYYLKQIAQSIAMRFEGVVSLENKLVVRW